MIEGDQGFRVRGGFWEREVGRERLGMRLEKLLDEGEVPFDCDDIL